MAETPKANLMPIAVSHLAPAPVKISLSRIANRFAGVAKVQSFAIARRKGLPHNAVTIAPPRRYRACARLALASSIAKCTIEANFGRQIPALANSLAQPRLAALACCLFLFRPAYSNQPMTTDTKHRLRILVVDDELHIRKMLSICLETDGHEVIAVSNPRDALSESARHHFDVAFVDLHLKKQSGSDLVPELAAQSPWMRIVIVTAYASVDSAVQTMKRGAIDYIAKPFTPKQIRQITDTLAPANGFHHGSPGEETESNFTLESRHPDMQRLLSLAHSVAASGSTILIRGESGVGKGVLARAIHQWSDRAQKPFATISCPALSPQLLESELFGHVKGAFTGAVRDNPGRIATTAGGTLFLDEIGDLPPELQPKLLRFVQDKQYEMVGEAVTRTADVRIITATNIHLEEAVRTGKFREDLLYRINVISLDVPPLRERPDDIPALAEQFARETQKSVPITGFADEALRALHEHTWPGNIRELRNVVERAAILCQSGTIDLRHLPGSFLPKQTKDVELGDAVPMERLEEVHIRRVLARTKSLEEAARVLEMDPATLWRRRKKYGI
jgi:NtrC-family two-component system response regulator AlgB